VIETGEIMIKTLPSPALVIACVALFVALGGTGYAATQLASGREQATVSAKHKSNRGPRGPRGLKGPKGPTGPAGPQGQVGPAGPNLEQVFAQKDGGSSGTPISTSGRKEVNRVTFNAPSNGALVISGHAFVSNSSASVQPFVLEAKLDGVDTTQTGWNATIELGAAGAASNDELSYATTVPVTAGAHDVEQFIGPYYATATSFFYNNQELTVMFVPNASFSSPSN
jgi:hypothetical protein